MTFIDLLLFSVANLKRNKMRTVLTIAGVVVGIAAIVFLVSLGFGLQMLVKQNIGSMKDLTQVKIEPDPKSADAKLDEATIRKFKKIKGVRWVSPSYYLSGQLLVNKQKIDLTIYAVDPKYLNEIDVKADVGKPPSSSNAQEIIVSRSALKVFDLAEAKNIVGKKATIKIFIKDKNGNMSLKITDKNQVQDVNVVGVSKGVKEAAAYIPINNLEKLDIATYDQVLIKSTKPGEGVKDLKTQLVEMGFKVTITEDILSKVDRVFKAVQIVLGAFGMIALFVASIGIFNTMTISLLERTHEIGVMKAIGATNKDVRRMFLIEAAQIGFWGGLFGLACGWIAGQGVNYLVDLLAKKFQGNAADIFYIPWQFGLISILFALIVSLLAGIYPARRAGKLNPLEAIRYE